MTVRRVDCNVVHINSNYTNLFVGVVTQNKKSIDMRKRKVKTPNAHIYMWLTMSYSSLTMFIQCKYTEYVIKKLEKQLKDRFIKKFLL